MTDESFDALVRQALRTAVEPSTGTWLRIRKARGFEWLPSPAETLAAACFAGALILAAASLWARPGPRPSPVQIVQTNSPSPFDSTYEAVSRVEGAGPMEAEMGRRAP